jgi:hypothetical protein
MPKPRRLADFDTSAIAGAIHRIRLMDCPGRRTHVFKDKGKRIRDNSTGNRREATGARWNLSKHIKSKDREP